MIWLWVVLGLGAAVVVYASLLERNWYALRRHTVPCLPPGAPPMRVLHISDLHLRARQRRKQRWLRALGRLDPHLIVGTGDFLGEGSPQTLAATVETLAAMPASIARVFVLGSNDYYGPVPKNPLRYFRRRKGPPSLHGPQNPWEDMVAGLKEAGWLFINNTATEVETPAVEAPEVEAPEVEAPEVDWIEVVGLDDAHIMRDDRSLARPRAPDDQRFRLGVAHSPDSAPVLAAAGFDLIMCGHTHGGQVRLPGYGALVTNCSLPRTMARGLHRFNGAWLHVNAGLGTNMFAPYRLACRPEACLLDLVPRQG